MLIMVAMLITTVNKHNNGNYIKDNDDIGDCYKDDNDDNDSRY